MPTPSFERSDNGTNGRKSQTNGLVGLMLSESKVRCHPPGRAMRWRDEYGSVVLGYSVHVDCFGQTRAFLVS